MGLMKTYSTEVSSQMYSNNFEISDEVVDSLGKHKSPIQTQKQMSALLW